MPLATHVASRQRNHDKLDILDEHIHSSVFVRPTLAAGKLVEGAGVWTPGAFKEIIAVNDIGSDFDIHWINIEGATADDIFELILYVETTEITRERFTITLTAGNRVTLPPLSTQTPILQANSQVQAKVASAAGNQDVTISLEGHMY